MERIVIPPYDQYDLSTFVINNNTVYIGHLGAGGANFKEQMENLFIKLKKYLREINLDLGNIAKLTVILKDIDDFKKMHEIWCKYFNEGDYPVRVVVTSEFVNPSCLVQIEGIACLK